MGKETKPPNVQIYSTRRLLGHPFLQVDEVEFDYLLPGENLPAPARRTKRETHLIVQRGDSVAALLHEPQTGLLHFVRQFRLPTFRRDDDPEGQDGWLVELVAGVLQNNETPRESIKREIREETGFVSVGQCDLIGSFYLSPGAGSERLFLFYVTVEATGRVGEQHGEVRGIDGEQIVTISMTPAEFLRQVETLTIADAKTVAAAEYIRRKNIGG